MHEICGCKAETVKQQVNAYDTNNFVARIILNRLQKVDDDFVVPICKRCLTYKTPSTPNKSKKHPLMQAINYLSSAG